MEVLAWQSFLENNFHTAKFSLISNIYAILVHFKEFNISDSNIEDLKKMINHIGGWSLLDPNWKEKDFSLVEFFSKSMEIGYFPKSLFVIDTQMCPITRQSIIIVRENNQHRQM